MNFNKKRKITRITAAPGEAVEVREITPAVNIGETSVIQGNQSTIDMEKNFENTFEKPRSSEKNTTNYYNDYNDDMTTEWQPSKSSSSEILNLTGGVAETESAPQIKMKNIIELLKIIAPLFKHITSGSFSNLTDDKLFEFMQAILEKKDPNLKTSNFSQHTEDWLPNCIQAVTEKLTDWNKETFRKADLTKSLQKKYNAKEIEAILKVLTLQKIIAPVPEEKSKRGGRPKSQKYRINYGEIKKDKS